jgi:ribosomal-protein-alanine N-acetyltransferase
MDDPFEPVETHSVHLRCVAPADAGPTAALMTSAISRWLSHWPMPFTEAMASARIDAARAMAYRGDALPFAIVGKSDRVLMGWAMIHRDGDDRRRASFGYWLGERFQGRGYMRDVAPSALAAGFAVLDVDVIEAGAQTDHPASFAVMRGCGMRFVRDNWVHAPARGRDEYCRFYEVRRDEWIGGVSARP